jgi:hypothetical protein
MLEQRALDRDKAQATISAKATVTSLRCAPRHCGPAHSSFRSRMSRNTVEPIRQAIVAEGNPITSVSAPDRVQ